MVFGNLFMMFFGLILCVVCVCVSVCVHAGICISAYVVISCLGVIGHLWSVDFVNLEALFLPNPLVVFLSFCDAINTYARPLDGALLVAQMIKNLPTMQETQVWSLGREDSLEKEMTTHSSILAWGIPQDKGVWWAIVHGVAKSWIRLSDYHIHTQTTLYCPIVTKTIVIRLLSAFLFGLLLLQCLQAH